MPQSDQLHHSYLNNDVIHQTVECRFACIIAVAETKNKKKNAPKPVIEKMIAFRLIASGALITKLCTNGITKRCSAAITIWSFILSFNF